MRRGAAAAAVAAAALLVAGGCGNDQGPAAKWEGKPVVVRHPEIPGDRLLVARVRNTSGDELRLDNRTVKVLDGDGRAVRASIRFSVATGHGLYSPLDEPANRPRFERERLGDAATVLPGRSTPLVLAWHAQKGSRSPVKVDLGPSTLDLPAAP